MKLFKHQQEALKQTELFNKVAYYLDMGLGKTFVGSEKMIELGNNVNLVICQKSKIKDWIDHFKKFYKNGKVEVIDDVLDLTDKKQFELFVGLIKTDSSLYPPHYKCVAVINYELAWRRKGLLKLSDFTLMLDESSLIQNASAKQSKFILKMKPSNVILLSGTPSSGKYENLWTQIHLLGWNISEALYNKQYVNWVKLEGDFPVKVVDKENPYKNVDRLKSKMREYGAVFMKTEECFELPEQIFTNIYVDTTKDYRKFMKTSLITMDTRNLCEFQDDSDYYGTDVTPRVELVGDTVLTKRLYLRQLCGQYNKDKLDAFKDLVRSTQDRLIVFYNYNAELEALKRIINSQDRPLSEVNGQTKDLTTYETEDNSITLIQYQAGSMGLNLQKANKIVYFTLTDKSEHFEQSKKRIHRIGQNDTCFYYILMCRNSVEESILQALEERKDYNDELFREYEKTR